MSKSSSSKLVLSNLYHYILSKPPQFSNPNATSSGISYFLSNHSKIIEKPAVNPWVLNCQRTHFLSSQFPRVLQNPSKKLDPDDSFLWNRKLLGFRYFSLKSSALGFGKNVLKDPVGAAKNTALRYKDAVGLQIEAFWKRNSMVLLGAAGIMVYTLLSRVLFGIATTYIGLSEDMAILALSSAIAAFAYDMKLLAVDIPMASEPDQRLFLIGDEEEYRVGCGLIAEIDEEMAAKAR